MAIAEAAMSGSAMNGARVLHSITEDQVRKKLRIAKTDLEKIENAEIINFVLDVLEDDASVPLCRDSKLVSADRSASIFVSRTGLTYSDALLKCIQNTLNPSRIKSLMENPAALANDDECHVVSTCERNHEKLASERASTQLKLVQERISAVENE
jgi:hypothetical protein